MRPIYRIPPKSLPCFMLQARFHDFLELTYLNNLWFQKKDSSLAKGSVFRFHATLLYSCTLQSGVPLFFSNLRLMARISFKKGSAWKVILSPEFQTEIGIKVSNPSENSVLHWKWYWYLNVLDGLDVPPAHNNCHPCHPFFVFFGCVIKQIKNAIYQ